MGELSEQTVLVTGSTRGIGHAIATRLLRAGATVGIHGRREADVDAVCQTLDDLGRTIPVPADLTTVEGAETCIERFREQVGHIDGLVNNAGGGKAVAFRGLTPERWRETFAINLDAAQIISRSAYTCMRKRKRGAMVNIASLAAHGPGKWMGADYAAAKAGLVSMTRSLAFEAARIGIRVNAVSPGMIATDMTDCLPEAMRRDLKIPLQRLGRPEEVAEAVLFLLSERSAYITGQVLHVNGGLHM